MQIKITSLTENKKGISLEVNSNQPFNINKLSALSPDFVAVTWIGNFEDLIIEEIPAIKIAKQLISKDLVVLLHIPSRNLNKNTALDVLNVIKRIGVRNVLALKGQTAFVKERDDSKVDFPYASHFVEFIKQNFNDYFAIGVTGYPEKHPNSFDFEEDINQLRFKVSKGADFILTQASFEDSIYEKFHESCRSHSIDVPIFVGTIILTAREELKIIENLCKISLNNEIREAIEKQAENDVFHSFGKRKFIDLGKRILKNKSCFAGIHIFSLNNSRLIEFVYDLNELLT